MNLSLVKAIMSVASFVTSIIIQGFFFFKEERVERKIHCKYCYKSNFAA